MNRIAALLACLAALAAGAEEKMLVKEVVVKAPVEEVYKAWSTSEGVASFFAPEARIEARPDGPFEVYMNPYAKPGLKGADDMRFMALQPPTMLSFDWNAPPSLPEAVREAQDYTWHTLKKAYRPGMGQFLPDRLFWAREGAEAPGETDEVVRSSDARSSH